MKLPRLLTGIVSGIAAISLTVGCGDLEEAAKEAAEDAAGISQLDKADLDALLTSTGAAEKLSLFKIHGGFDIKENFPADLSQTAEVEVPIPLPAPASFDAASGKARSILFLRAKEFTVADSKMTRLEVVTVAKVEPTATGAKLSIQGGEFTAHLDEDQKVTKATQAGRYVIAEGEGTGGLVFIKGAVNLKKQGVTDLTLVKGATIYSDASPFVTQTGSAGQFVLPVPEGVDGNVNAFHQTIGTVYSAPGTPSLATKVIAKAGLLDQYKGDVSSKMDDLGVGSSAKSDALAGFDKLNTAVTDFFDAWTTVALDLVFVQPPQTPPAAPTPPSKPTEKTDPPSAPSSGNVAIRGEGTSDPQVDLGCTGVDENGKSTFIADGSKYDDYTNNKGWRVFGSVFSSVEEAANLFGDPATIRSDAEKAKRFPDTAKGYCVISTGNGLFKKQGGGTTAQVYNPGPDGAGQVSEMWQKIQIPKADTGYNYIKVRVAFFSQEFPQWVGSGFNDSFFVGFDETDVPIGTGNLNDLAGGPDKVKDCKSKTFTAGTQTKCGEWESITGSKLSTGKLWYVDNSDNAVSKGSSYHCGTGKCYHGFIPARVLCRKLDPETEQGKQLTLRFNVSDAGDKYYDSALAVDSVVFSNEDCSASAFAGDPRSMAKQE